MAAVTDWRHPKWSEPQPLVLQGVGDKIMAKCTPALLGYANELLCVWVNGQDTLFYSRSTFKPLKTAATAKEALEAHKADFFGHRTWSTPAPITTFDLPERPERARCAPCLAVSHGQVHLVFVDPVGYLVHLKYEPQEWESVTHNILRKGLYACWLDRTIIDTDGRAVTEPPALCVCAGSLYCAYKRDERDEPGSVRLVRLDNATGQWTPLEGARAVALDAKGKVGLAAISDELHMYCCPQDNRRGVLGARLRPDAGMMDAELPPVEILATSEAVHGVSMVSYSGVVTMCFDAYGALITREYGVDDRAEWSLCERHVPDGGRTPVGDAPVVTALDNEFVCFWRAEAPEGKASPLWYMTRRIRGAPPLDRWMDAIVDDRKISYLTIPGAHDAASWSKVPFTGTQLGTITTLLEMGIRYLDVRARAKNPGGPLILAHGPIALWGDRWFDSLYLDDLFKDCYSFMALHPSEGIVIQLSHEVPEPTPQQSDYFVQTVKALISTEYNGHPAPWLLTCHVPTVAELRGHIQLIRRFPLPEGEMPQGQRSYGIDLSTGWGKNDISEISYPHPDARPDQAPIRFKVQDHYDWDYGLIPETRTHAPDLANRSLLLRDVLEDIIVHKWSLVRGFLDRSAGDDQEDTIFINFASANPFRASRQRTVLEMNLGWVLDLIIKDFMENGPWEMAAGVPVYKFGWYNFYVEGLNYRLASYLRSSGPGTYGVVMMDFPQVPRDLVGLLVNSNWPFMKEGTPAPPIPPRPVHLDEVKGALTPPWKAPAPVVVPVPRPRPGPVGDPASVTR
ncbi:PLC-like phosphodiesterase [Podospora aff. communis PSN243]|uniref:PLC-like phosphodiesterase n=1 Tax=Podospora aff. communis PSN243 TaxID=3040156 RepID=A0AAV9GM00_9PEZI|nr:PLC-like phosphodiesterase [Podospora aff. communis PSN243]